MSALQNERSRTVLHTGTVDSAPPPGRSSGQTRLTVSQALLSASLLLTWGLVYLVLLSGLEQGHAQEGLYDRLRTELAEGTAPTGAPIAAGSPVALLSVPAAGIDDLVVVEGSRPQQLQEGPGHVLGSVLPGQQGVSVLAGRSLSFGAPFADLGRLTTGAGISVTTAQGTFVYDVVGLRSEGDPRPAPLADGQARLTLMTAARGTGLGALQASQVLYVDAELAEGVVPAGPTAGAVLDDHRMSVSADTTTLALLALTLQLLIGALAAFVWAWTRWSRAAAWVAVAPCVLAALWLASSLGSRLLPGLV